MSVLCCYFQFHHSNRNIPDGNQGLVEVVVGNKRPHVPKQMSLTEMKAYYIYTCSMCNLKLAGMLVFNYFSRFHRKPNRGTIDCILDASHTFHNLSLSGYNLRGLGQGSKRAAYF